MKTSWTKWSFFVLKAAICVLILYFIILCCKPNALDGIGKQKVNGAVKVSEIEQGHDPWETLLCADYARMDERERANRDFIAAQLWEKEGIEGASWVECKAVWPMRIEDADGEIYLFHYFIDVDYDGDGNDLADGNYRAIWVNPQNNSSQVLFHTEGIHGFTSLYEFFDMQVGDVDGNGEEDVVLLLGAHRWAGAGYYLPDLYCMAALQKNSKFECINSVSEEWVEEALHPLYSQQHENWKAGEVIEALKSHYGNSEIKEEAEEAAALEDVIAIKDRRILEKVDSRSLFYERELLWETCDMDENDHLRGIKVYKEQGENGMPSVQVAVYLFDYVTEEAKKLEVPSLYQEITDQYSPYGIDDVELKEIEIKEIEGTKYICLKVEIMLGSREQMYEYQYQI